MQFSRLFSPIEINGTAVRNRVVMAPMGGNFENIDGSVSDGLIDYFEERARGGVGLIISPFTAIDDEQRAATLSIGSDRFVPGINRLAEAVQQHGARFILQLAHPGAKVMDTLTGRQPVAPSAIKSPIYWKTPRELSEAEIDALVEQFAQAAARAEAAGCDGVEIHGAHTYLIGAFISPHCNKRTDKYGGDFYRRMAFPTAIASRIHELCGDGFVVGFKFSAHEELEGGVDVSLARQIAAHMEGCGVHYIHVASTSSIPHLLEVSSDYPSGPSIYSPPGVLLRLADRIKDVVSVPVIGGGGVVDPAFADEVLRGGRVDMVFTGRAQIADPSWAARARDGSPLRFCIKCNICHRRLYSKQRLKCSVNPVVGEERRYRPCEATELKRVVIVGAGPAGMEAALVARARGHGVVLYEANDRVGGNMIPGSMPDFKAEIGKLLEYYETSILDKQIDLRLGQRIEDTETLRGDRPDAVIWATGAKLNVPEIELSHDASVRTVLDIYGAEMSGIGDSVLVVGAGFVGCETAWYLASHGKSVTLIDSLSEEELLSEEHPTNRRTLLTRLAEHGVDIRCRRAVGHVDRDKVSLKHEDGTVESIPADDVVIATGFIASPELERWRESELTNNSGIEFVPVGDCIKPGNLFDAIHAGFVAGWNV